MGFGDPDHQHILQLHRLIDDIFICVKCELPMGNWGYTCKRCNYFVHRLCFQLPQAIEHPLHQQHSLILLHPTSLQITSAYCNECQNPCIGKYTYHCSTCLEFNLHLKCFLTFNERTKHHHPLSLNDCGNTTGNRSCRICGLPIDIGFVFGCQNCDFYIHFECPFLPPKIEHHHVHELAFSYNFPEECEQVYCDVCEDKDDKELDRSLSYYYCKRCDYIAHVHCVTTQMNRGTIQLEHFVHEHPLVFANLSWDQLQDCAACKRWVFGNMYKCTECNFRLHKSCTEFPRYLKHPHHENHILSIQSYVHHSLHHDHGFVPCGFCRSPLYDNNIIVLQCTECDYIEHLRCALRFNHPLCKDDLFFSAGDGTSFRCNACGELGDSYRMSHNFIFGGQYDLHLECFALQGETDHSCHSHPLFLVSLPKEFVSSLSTSLVCNICCTEVDPELWVYLCKQCNYFAHLKCVADDLLSALRASNNCSNLCTITQSQKERFHIDKKSMCFLLVHERYTFSVKARPVFLSIKDITDQSTVIISEPVVQSADVLHCPKCELPISAQIYSCVNDWMHHNQENKISTTHSQISVLSDPLTLLDEKSVDQLYCPICNQSIFPPTYSCVECQIYFHKSCAELPRNYTIDPGHTFIFVSPSLQSEGLPDCTFCDRAIKGYAYTCSLCKVFLHVQCALGAPLLRQEHHEHSLFSWPSYSVRFLPDCRACGKYMNKKVMCFKCVEPNCGCYLHAECALLPYMVSHRIHWHSLVIEPHLDTSVDDYVCDACEKDLNPNLWAYRCSDSCGDRATSHVSCIVTSNKKRHFRYNIECRGEGEGVAEDNIDHDLADELEEQVNVKKGIGTF